MFLEMKMKELGATLFGYTSVGGEKKKSKPKHVNIIRSIPAGFC